MSDHYKVWVQIERIPGDGSEPENVTDEEEIAIFSSEEEARWFVRWAATLKPLHFDAARVEAQNAIRA